MRKTSWHAIFLDLQQQQNAGNPEISNETTRCQDQPLFQSIYLFVFFSALVSGGLAHDNEHHNSATLYLKHIENNT